MRQDYERLFQQLHPVEPPSRLLAHIQEQVAVEERRMARRRVFLLGGTALVSLVALVPATQYVAKELYRTGFYEYLSLLFSDSASLPTYWQEFLLSLAESLPLVASIAFLAVLLTFLGSAKFAIRNAPTAFMRTQLT